LTAGFVITALSGLLAGCQTAELQSKLPADDDLYQWIRLSESAAFPQSYNFPVFVTGGRMRAFLGQGVWESVDGATWNKTQLEPLRQDVYRTQYVNFSDAIYALGDNRGNYESMVFGSKVRRTRDFKSWEVVAERTSLPGRIFPGLIVFRGKIWLLGGYDGRQNYDDVWNSTDGAAWTRVVEHAGWTPRNSPALVVFRERLWLLGGGVIDGMPDTNPSSKREIWSTVDGIAWTKSENELPVAAGGDPIVFDGKLWLVGANRDGAFGRSSLVTEDLTTWQQLSAPWSPRGGVATWVLNGELFMTGGKYSITENGQIRFIYSNDVWKMTKTKG
jgi:hypothetical protein